ncbi:MAG: hypothetical protein IEMM0002_0132 [bacterium]|nr:MAG: hypothetical protein IEMM0002_0132 [bacterium]
MSLVINTTIPEGIVLAADSRQSYRNRKGMARIGSDNASKLFQINKRIGVAITGLAFLPENGVLKNISKYIEQFKHEKDTNKLSVKKAAEKLHALFSQKYNWQDQMDGLIKKIENDLSRQGLKLLDLKKDKGAVKFRFIDGEGKEKNGAANIDPVNLLVAGYNDDASHEVCRCDIPGAIRSMRDSQKKGMEYGATWMGQEDVVTRIILGFDNRIGNLKFFNEAIQKHGSDEINKQLTSLQYNIQWGTMTLQDAIDISTLMIQTTSAIQRFSDGIMADPGDMPGVGGPVDIAVIKQDKGFIWISKKKLTVGNVEVDIDKI